MLESISVNIEAGVSLRKGANVLRVKNMDIFSAQTRVISFDELLLEIVCGALKP